MFQPNMPSLENPDDVHESPERKTPRKAASFRHKGGWTVAAVPHDVHDPVDPATLESREEMITKRRTRLEEVVNEHDSLVSSGWYSQISQLYL
jgi:hypothetical protein